MALDREDVEKVAHLARLQLSPDEVRQFQKQLSAVLDYVDQLNELDLEEVPPTSHAVAQQNVFRDDEVEPSLTREDVLYNAPAEADDQFLIQTVLGDE